MIEIPIWLFALNCVAILAFFIETTFFPRDFEKEKNYKNMERQVANQTEYISLLRSEIKRLRNKYE